MSEFQKISEEAVIQALKKVYDPELPVNIYDLGLIYKIRVNPLNQVEITMTLTAPGCPVAEQILKDVESVVAALDGVTSSKAILVWDPPYSKSMMSDAAKLALNL